MGRSKSRRTPESEGDTRSLAKKARHVAQRQPAEVMHEPMARTVPTSETGQQRLPAPSSCKEWAHHANDSYVRLNSGAQLLHFGRELLHLIELHPGALGTFYRSFKLYATSRRPDVTHRDIFPMAVPGLSSLERYRVYLKEKKSHRQLTRYHFDATVAVWMRLAIIT